MRRLNSSKIVFATLTVALLFSLLYNTPHWFELELQHCESSVFQGNSVKVIETDLLKNEDYFAYYRVAAYFLFMFSLPFFVLLLVNYKIAMTVKKANARRGTIAQDAAKPQQTGQQNGFEIDSFGQLF